MALSAERRAALLAAKLSALVGDRASGDPGPFPGGATLVAGDEGWVLVDDQPERALGAAMAWGSSRGLAGSRLHLVVDRHAGLLARQAGAFVDPPRIWQVDGTALVAAEPEPAGPAADPPESAMALVGLLEDQGVDVVVDHGEVIGEVLGLEVARVVIGHDGVAHLEVGVGRNDREAFALIHADQDPADALASVVATVSAQRRPGAAPHPLNRLGAARWMRARLVADPARVGAAHLEPVPGVLPRGGVKETVPVAAVGADPQGRPMVVVTSTGIDLDLVPAAADLRLAHAPDAELVLAVPERDAHPVTHRLAAALVDPAQVVGLPGDWRS